MMQDVRAAERSALAGRSHRRGDQAPIERKALVTGTRSPLSGHAGACGVSRHAVVTPTTGSPPRISDISRRLGFFWLRASSPRLGGGRRAAPRLRGRLADTRGSRGLGRLGSRWAARAAGRLAGREGIQAGCPGARPRRGEPPDAVRTALGYPALREELQTLMSRIGVEVARPDPDHVGTSHAFDLVVRAMSGRRPVLVEDPGYYNLYGFYRFHAPDLIGVRGERTDRTSTPCAPRRSRPWRGSSSPRRRCRIPPARTPRAGRPPAARRRATSPTLVEDDTYCDLDPAEGPNWPRSISWNAYLCAELLQDPLREPACRLHPRKCRARGSTLRECEVLAASRPRIRREARLSAAGGRPLRTLPPARAKPYRRGAASALRLLNGASMRVFGNRARQFPVGALPLDRRRQAPLGARPQPGRHPRRRDVFRANLEPSPGCASTSPLRRSATGEIPQSDS